MKTVETQNHARNQNQDNRSSFEYWRNQSQHAVEAIRNARSELEPILNDILEALHKLNGQVRAGQLPGQERKTRSRSVSKLELHMMALIERVIEERFASVRNRQNFEQFGCLTYKEYLGYHGYEDAEILEKAAAVKGYAMLPPNVELIVSGLFADGATSGGVGQA